MSEHFIFAKPFTVTEERLKEAVAKQAKQKALREALDRQILESERVKKEEARRARRHTPLNENDVNHTGEVKSAAPMGRSPRSTPPPAKSTKEAAEPEVSRYTCNFNGEQASFIKETVSNGPRGGRSGGEESGQPHGERAGRVSPHPPSAGQARKQKPSAKPKATGAEAAQPASSRAASPREPSDPAQRTRSPQARQHQPRGDAKLAALAEPKNRRALEYGARGRSSGDGGTPPVYQTNSLPVDISGYGRAAGDAPADKRRGISKGRKGAVEEPVYDTQSLPVDLAWKLGRGDANRLVAAPLNDRSPRSPSFSKAQQRPAKAGNKSRPASELRLRRRSSPEIEAVLPASPSSAYLEYQTGCLPRDFSLDNESGAQLLSAAKHNGSPLGPRPAPATSRTPSHGKLLPLKPTQGFGRDGRRLSPRTPGRPAGGVLPPLSHCGSAESDSVIEMSAMLDVAGETSALSSEGRPPPPSSSSSVQPQLQPHRAPLALSPPERRVAGGGAAAARTSSRESQGVAPPQPQQLRRLQKQLESRDNVVRRMQEKEKSWEDQVQRLKAELRSARKKERELARGGPSVVPPRAETAPDPPAPTTKAPGGSRRREPSSERAEEPQTSTVRGGRVLTKQGSREKPDFSRAHIFTTEEFRPITAPDYPQHSYVPSSSPSEPLQRGEGWDGSGEKDDASSKRKRAGRRAPAPQRSTESADATRMVNGMASSSVLGVSETSLKLASLTTRQTAFGLDEGGASTPAPIAFDHLVQFADAQLITQTQAENLWKFFCELKGVPVLYDRNGAIVRQHAGRTSAKQTPPRRRHDTHSLVSGEDDDSFDDDDEEEEEEEEEEGDYLVAAQGEAIHDDSVSSPSRAPLQAPESGRRGMDYHQSPSPVSAMLTPALRKKISLMQAAAAEGGKAESAAVAGRSSPTAAPPPLPIFPANGAKEERMYGDGRPTPLTPQLHNLHRQQQQQRSKSPAEKGGGGNATLSRSPASHSSEGATLADEEEDGAGTASLSGPGSLSTHDTRGQLLQHGRLERFPNDTFDTSVELYPPSEY